MTTDNKKQKSTTMPLSPDELAKSLGQSQAKQNLPEKPAEKPADLKPAEKPEAKPEETLLAKILSLLDEKSRNKINSLPEESRLDIAKDYFAMTHPEGMASEFKAKLTVDLPAQIQKLADDYMVSVKGQEVVVRFPNGEGAVTIELRNPNASKESSSGKGKSGGTWGKVTVEDAKGGLHYYDSLGQAKTRLNIKTDWGSDMFEGFTKAGFTVKNRPTSKDGSGCSMKAPEGFAFPA